MNLKNNYLLLAPIVLMAATRVHHFGSAVSLPDASLAAFFLAGLLSGNRRLLLVLLVQAGLLDYWAINYFGVSDFCISPAYVFLIPTYATMWFAGRYSKHLSCSMVSTAVVAGLATSAAFVMSNASFFLFSGRYGPMPTLDYAAAVAPYYPPYLAAALCYVLAGLLVLKARKSLPLLYPNKAS